MTKTAVLSVYDKAGIEDFAKELVVLGWQLYASGGTAKHLRAHHIEVKDTTELVGSGAILGHRVVTLSREVYAGLLATDAAEDVAELKKLKIPRIDLVCVDLYPLSDEISKPGASETSVIEQTDIGGPTLLRAAAKGRRIVISQPTQRSSVIKWLKNNQPDKASFLRDLAADAEAVVAQYALESARFTSDGRHGGQMYHRAASAKYGENPWQQHAWLYAAGENDDPLALHRFAQRLGTPPSYNNYADFDRLLQTMTHIAAGFKQNSGAVPSIALGGKHGNVCGAAVGDDAVTVTERMLEGDERAIFGGVMMLNFPIDSSVAETLVTHHMDGGRRLIDGIAAPGIDDAALEQLQRKGDKCRVLINPVLAKLNEYSLDRAQRSRYVRGGQLLQDNYTLVLDLESPELEQSDKLQKTTAHDVVLGWAIGSTSNSNTITLINGGMLIGNGVGQQDRVSAAELAVKRARDAGHDLKDATAYSDSFFPFPDGPESLAKAGIKTIFASSGSVGDKKVRAACETAGVNLVTLPDKQVRGFYAH